MMPFRHVADRFFNRPLLLRPEAADTIGSVLLARMGEIRAGGKAGLIDSDAGETFQAFRSTERADGSYEVHSPRASRFYGDYPKGSDGRPLPYRRTADGTAILTLIGEFVNRGAWVGASSGLISYEGFSYQIARAVADPDTRAILLDIESPGGEAVGAFEAAAVVRDAAQRKPVTALVNGMAASAAYAIASGANRIVTIPTGICGSVGVVLVHFDFSQWLKEEGVKPTLIFAGDHKVDGNPFEPLPKNVRDELQRDVAGFYEQFVETVAVGRKLEPSRVRDTQARVFKGDDAVAAGLADSVGTFESVLSEMSSAPVGRNHQGATMSDKSGAAAETNAGISQAEHGAAVDAAAKGAQARVKAILGDKSAKGRAALAQHLALETSLPAAEAIGILEKSPLETAPRQSRLDGGAVPSPQVDAAGEAPADAQAIEASWNRVVAQVNKETAAARGR